MARVFSGIQPSGDLHLGNYIGALRQFAIDQHDYDSLFCVVDLHAITLPHDPAVLRAKTIEAAAVHLAAGLDPDVCTLFVQSHVHEHAELSWLMECTVSFGELSRMVQFKDKSARGEYVSGALFTYPALMAADILLYDTDRVPIGEDQRQHLEITRDIAIRFNQRFGQTLVVPEAAIPRVGARIMDLQNPTAKMSKSVASPQGTVQLLEPPEAMLKKFRRAVTDSETEVRYDREAKPGVSNLLDILAVATGEDPESLASKYTQYGPLKEDAAVAVIEMLRPVQQRYTELASDPDEITRILVKGAEKAAAMAAPVLARAKDAVGLLPRG